jgi:hypothetical protein
MGKPFEFPGLGTGASRAPCTLPGRLTIWTTNQLDLSSADFLQVESDKSEVANDSQTEATQSNSLEDAELQQSIASMSNPSEVTEDSRETMVQTESPEGDDFQQKATDVHSFGPVEDSQD